MFHELVRTWFHWVEVWGYAGVFFLMALESTIVPVPSEIVMAPAAFWAAQGRMSLFGVITAGTLGSVVGSALNYWISRWVGLPVLRKYGKYLFLPPAKIELAESWIRRFGIPGVLSGRFLPVVRHLVSVPAGILRMPFGSFSLATFLGAGIWCSILAWFGQQVIGDRPELLDSPVAMISVIKDRLHWFVGGVFVLIFLYGLAVYLKYSPTKKTAIKSS